MPSEKVHLRPIVSILPSHGYRPADARSWPSCFARSTYLLQCLARPFVFVTSSFLLLVARPGATSGVLAPTSDALCY